MRLAIWLLLLATSNPRIKIDGCWSRYGIGIEHPETILWDPYLLAYRSLLKHLQVGGSSSSLKRKESSTMYLFLRKASTSPSLKPKCGYIYWSQYTTLDLFLKCKIHTSFIWYKRAKLTKNYFEIICSIKMANPDYIT